MTFASFSDAATTKCYSRCGRLSAIPDLTLMAVLVEHMEGQRDLITHKSVWHLNDQTIKNIYTLYIMFTVLGCCFFDATKDPYYDLEHYRKDGGDGTGHWVYEKETSNYNLTSKSLVRVSDRPVESLITFGRIGSRMI